MRKALLLAAFLAAPALASQAISISVEELTRRSDLILRGRVDGVSAAWSEDGARIFTTAEVVPSAFWRGGAAGTVKVLVPGGVVGHVAQRVDGAPSLTPGEEVVLFLIRAEAGDYRVSGLVQGKYTVERGVARPDLSKVEFVRVEVKPGEKAAGPMPLEELERRVRSVR